MAVVRLRSLWLRRRVGASRGRVRVFVGDSSGHRQRPSNPAGRSLRGLALPLDDVERSPDPTIQLVAEVVERGAKAWSMNLGYGPGEAVLVAHRLRPDIVEPLAQELARFGRAKVYDMSSSDDELDAMCALISGVRSVLVTQPKSHSDRA